MILSLDTSTPTTKIWLDDEYFEYETHRTLARDLLSLILKSLGSTDPTALSQITAITVFKGPGSFTGLRIGITVANTLADQLQIPIIGATGEAWRTEARAKLATGATDQLVLPEYGRPANITKPKK